jgi:hypothetical protein
MTVARTGRAGRKRLDCALSALSSFYGQPEISAPRWPTRSGCNSTRSLLHAAAELGLGPGDFVVSPSVAERLEQVDAGLLHHLQVGD